MAKAKKQDTGVQSWRKKKWIPIISEKIFHNAALGETPVAEAEKAVGKLTTSNMMTLTGEMRGQHISVVYKINSLREGKLFAHPVGYKISSAYIKRNVRRGRNRIDDSFLVKTKDDKVIRIKTMLITRFLIPRALRSVLKKVLIYETSEISTKGDFYFFFNEVLRFRYQNKIKAMLSKAYPLRQVEVKAMEMDEKVDPKDVVIPITKEIKLLQMKYKAQKEGLITPRRGPPRHDSRRPPRHDSRGPAQRDFRKPSEARPPRPPAR